MRNESLATEFVLNDGTRIHFGQKLASLEKLLATPAIDDPMPVARKGIDQQIVTQGLTLTFDTGRLKKVEFGEQYPFNSSLTFYPESWRNFSELGESRIRPGMSHEEFAAYMTEWGKRAKSFGATEAEDDLEVNQYRYSFHHDEYAHMFGLVLGPSRRARGGGLWADGWTAFFAMAEDANPGRAAGTLLSLSAFRDEFNSWARRPEWTMPPATD